MTSETKQLEKVVAALERQRTKLGSAATDAALAVLKQRLTALAVASQRKQITILFADVSGFTAISETMDPEDVITMMNTLWTRLDTAVLENGGRIDKHIGDSVMALWGVDASREDDPERAIRAALAMQRALSDFVRDKSALVKAMRSPLHIRIGINTGPVLLGIVGVTREFTAMGDAVNLASRLEKAAPVGGILISHDTFRHVRGIFETDSLGPIDIKGKSEQVYTYTVQGVRPRAFRAETRGVEGVETPMVGRDPELGVLQEAFRQALGQRTVQLVTVTADPGIGKTRLVAEFSHWLEALPESVWLFQGRASEQSAGVPYALIRDMLAERFLIQDTDSLADAQRKLVNGIASMTGNGADPAPTHLIGHLIGMDFSSSASLANILHDSRQIRQRAYHYLAQFFRQVSASDGGPIAILLEDIHWADDGSLDVIEHLLQECSDVPLLIVSTARPVLFERRPGWGHAVSVAQRVELKSLSMHDSNSVLSALLGKVDDLPEDLRMNLLRGAEGNPFFLEEMVKMLIDDGVIITGGKRWELDPARVREVRVPPTLIGVLQARLDSLPAGEKAILQRASIVGRRFWDMLVEYLAARDGETEARPALAALAERDLVFRQNSSTFAGTAEYIFKNAILREVTYESVLKALRPHFHREIANWLALRAGDRLSEYAVLIADHYERAGATEQAADYLRRAGTRALGVSAYREAIGFLERVLAVLPANAPDRATLLGQMAEAHANLSDYDSARVCLDEALRLASASGDDRAESQALLILGQTAFDQGDLEAAADYQQRSVTSARRAGDPEGIVRALYRYGFTMLQRREFAQSEAIFNEAREVAQQVDDKNTLAAVFSGLGVLCTVQDKARESVPHFEQGLALARQIGDRERVSGIVNNLGWAMYLMGDYPAARIHLEEAVSVTEEIGSIYRNLIATINLAHTLSRLNEIEQAASAYRYALFGVRRLEALGVMLEIVVGMAGLLVIQGDYPRAAEWVAAARNHPSARADTHQVAAPILAQLQQEMTAADFEAAEKRGKSRDLESVIEEIMEG